MPASVLLIAFAGGGCFVEARGRGDLFTTAAGPAVGGTVLGAEFNVGLELVIDHAARCRALLGGGGERAIAASRETSLDRRTAPRIALGFEGPWSSRRFEVHFGLAGYMPDAGSVSMVRLGAGGILGTEHLALLAGPAVAYWDAGRTGATVSLGAELAVRIFADPRTLIAR